MSRARDVELEAGGVGGEPVVLMPERAVYWPRERTLLVADLHWGKSQALRAAGAPVPAGILDEQLTRLACAIERSGPRTVTVLGDLLHTPSGLTPELIDRVAAWRAGREERFELVPGNHDRGVEHAARAWGLDVLEPVVCRGPFCLAHDPMAAAGAPRAAFTWAGHVHPAVLIRSGADALKLPCFHLTDRLGLLPAFSLFTAGVVIPADAATRVVAIAGEAAVEV